MLLTDQRTIREVLLFPHLRPERDQAEADSGDETGPEAG
jgi:hypothetical protein